jgi:hypothetical protein
VRMLHINYPITCFLCNTVCMKQTVLQVRKPQIQWPTQRVELQAYLTTPSVSRDCCWGRAGSRAPIKPLCQ